MKSLILLTVVAFLAEIASSFFIEPSIYSPKAANITICQSVTTDQANAATSANRVPYLSCPNSGTLKVQSCRLGVSTTKSCPLNFPGRAGYKPQSPLELKPGVDTLIRTDCTPQMTALCNTETECSFEWRQLGQLQLVYPDNNVANVREYQQQAYVVYTCSDKRKQC